MAILIMETQLTDAINGDRLLATRGCRAEPQQPSGVAVVHVRAITGIWYWRNGAFELESDAVSDAPVALDTVAEVVRYTREQLCPVS